MVRNVTGDHRSSYSRSGGGAGYEDSIGSIPVDRLLFLCAQGPLSGLIYKVLKVGMRRKYLAIAAGLAPGTVWKKVSLAVS